jgi:hypothetical protein
MTEKEVTEMEQLYLDKSGDACPFCESTEIVGGAFDSYLVSAWRSVECKSCGAIWRDMFKLIGIEIDS